MKRLIPDTLLARTLLVLIVGLAMSHAISVVLYISDRSNVLVSASGEHVGDRIAVVDHLIRNSSPAERARLLALADSLLLQITLTAESGVSETETPDGHATKFRDALIPHLSPDDSRIVRLKSMGMTRADGSGENAAAGQAGGKLQETLMISLSQPDGLWLNFIVRTGNPAPLWSVRFGLSLATMLVAVLVLSGLVTYSLTRPLAVFASAAQRLGADVRAPPLPESGPVEIRQATRAFNEMQGRIRRFVEDRTQMIAAIAHDLGTPIARVRLRAEYIEDEEQHEKLLADLDDMEKMVFSTLAFARDDAQSEPSARVDLRILLQRVCHDAVDTGQDVTLEIGDSPVPFTCHPTTLRRAFSNLVTNAVKYGKRAEVACVRKTDSIRITIADEGPGIPPERQEDVFKPFHRLEKSRSRDTGGTGLGMTVARSIIRAHGGDIGLQNRTQGGLLVVVKLPGQPASR
jgi:signal transduction histidine kinase